MENAILHVSYPGSTALMLSRRLAELRRAMSPENRVTAKAIHESKGITPQTLSNIEKGKTVYPSYNSLVKIADALGLCFVIDVSFNANARRDGHQHVDDSPYALYGEGDNPIEQFSEFLKKVHADMEKDKIKRTDIARIADIDYQVLCKMFNGENVRMDAVFDLLSELDYTLTIEFKKYHKRWDLVGKGRHVSKNDYNANRPNYKPLHESRSSRINNPSLSKPDGSHYFLKRLPNPSGL